MEGVGGITGGITGDVCPLDGEYNSSCGDMEGVPFVKGNTFSKCEDCGQIVEWILMRRIKDK